MKVKYARADALEMYRILRTAQCLKRYDSVSHQLLAELVVSIATEGEVIGGNNRGSDIISPVYGKIEVKSRLLGTDGPYPRVSLKPHNLVKSDWVVAVRWKRDFEFAAAVGLPKAAVISMISEDKLNATGVIHFAWKSWVSHPAAENMGPRVESAFAGLPLGAEVV